MECPTTTAWRSLPRPALPFLRGKGIWADWSCFAACAGVLFWGSFCEGKASGPRQPIQVPEPLPRSYTPLRSRAAHSELDEPPYSSSPPSSCRDSEITNLLPRAVSEHKRKRSVRDEDEEGVATQQAIPPHTASKYLEAHRVLATLEQNLIRLYKTNKNRSHILVGLRHQQSTRAVRKLALRWEELEDVKARTAVAWSDLMLCLFEEGLEEGMEG